MRTRKLFAGARLKTLRRNMKLTQVRMAEELGVSASYLNLMERNQRPVTAQVLIRLVETYDLDLGVFAAEPDQRIFLALREAGSDPVLASLGLDDTDIKELNEVHPLGAQAVVRLHKAYRNISNTHAGLTEKLSDRDITGPTGLRPEEIVDELVQETEGYYDDIEEAAELFCDEIQLDRSGLFSGLTARLQQLHSIRTRVLPDGVLGVQKRRYDRHSRRVLLSSLLNDHERCFQLAEQIAHLELRDLFDEKCLDGRLQAAGTVAVQLYKSVLARVFAMAVLLPYAQVQQAAEETRYDLHRLTIRFETSIEKMARRLASLRRPGAQGLPLFFLRLDRAGNVIERGGAKSYSFTKFGGTCPKWNIWAIASGAGEAISDFVELPDGERLMSVAFRSTRLDPSAALLPYSQTVVLGCAANRAFETIYGSELGEARELAPTLIGPSCRACERTTCGQRAAPSVIIGSKTYAGTATIPMLSCDWDGAS